MGREAPESEAGMIEALQQVVRQIEQLPEESQAKIVAEIHARLVEYQRWEAERERVSQMSKDEFAAFLEERKVSKPYLTPGYRGIYYSEEEFDEALRLWSGPEAIALYEHQKNASDANV